MGGGSWGDPSKASSAFSPINSGVGLPTSTGLSSFFSPKSTSSLILPVFAGFNMGGAGRGYPFYDPISFQRQSQVRFKSVQSFNPFKVEKIGFYSTGVTATCRRSQFPQSTKTLCRAEISKLIPTCSKTFFLPPGWVRVEDGGVEPDLPVADQELRARQGRAANLMILPGGRSARATRAGQYLLQFGLDLELQLQRRAAKKSCWA